jgi:RNA polymerase primary sigma factor
MKNKTDIELIKIIQKNKNQYSNAKNELCSRYINLVRFHAKKYLFGGHQIDDLVQEGWIGLNHAFEKCDLVKLSKGKFSTYASLWIQQAIRKYITNDKQIRIPSGRQQEISQIQKIIISFENQNGKPPSLKYIAKKTKNSIPKIEDLLKNMDFMYFSINHNGFNVGDENIDLEDNTTNPLEKSEINSNKEYTRSLLEKLSKREKYILERRFGINDKPQTLEEIAKKIGITRERVRQIEKESLQKLKIIAKR